MSGNLKFFVTKGGETKFHLNLYLSTFPEHYRCHIIFVKATKHKRISDTVFFKHKHITQLTIMPADGIVNACQNLMQAIQGILGSKSEANILALERIQNMLAP